MFCFLIPKCWLLHLDRSEQALECEETAVASVASAGPADEAAALGILQFRLLYLLIHNIPIFDNMMTDMLDDFYDARFI